MAVDTLVYNGRVLTMVPGNAPAEALAIAGNRIVAVGTDEELAPLADGKTRRIDAAGGTVLPGFVESHMHLFPGAFSLRLLQLGDVSGEAALSDALRGYARQHPDEGLLVAQAVDYAILGDGKRLDRHVLDRILPDRPVALVSVDLHNVWANTIALDRAGLLHGADPGSGAEVEMAPDGRASGLLKEFAAFAPVMALRTTGGREHLGLENREPQDVSPEARANDKRAMEAGLAHCASLGITTIVNMDGNRYQLALLAEIEAESGLPCRVDMPYHFTPGEDLRNLERAEQFRRDAASSMLWCNRIKLFMDGVIDAETAFRLSDYPGRPGFRSAPLHDRETFARIATEADRRGFQIAVHAIGDAAVRMTLDGYQAAQQANGVRDARHRLEHIEMIHPDDVPRLEELGVTASLQPVHPPGCDGFPLEPAVTIIGRQQWSRAFPWRRLADAGAHVCFSSDWPVATLDPLHGMATARARQPWADDLPDERLSVDDTIAAYTSGGAYAAHLDDRLGTLAPDMLADVVILSGDLEVALETGQALPAVVETICDGRTTWRQA